MATLGMILRSNSLATLVDVDLSFNEFGDAGLQALCDGLGRGCAPSLRSLVLMSSKFGPAGAEAIAAALRRGAMPNLVELVLGNNLGRTSNKIGNQGMTVLAPALRKRPALMNLYLWKCGIGDEGVASMPVSYTHLTLPTKA